MVQRSALAHSDYSAVDPDCSCLVCVDWRAKFEVIKQAKRRVSGHARNCYCADCKTMRIAQGKYRAADSKRELYCEFSFHAAECHDGIQRMAWLLDRVILSQDYSDNWWNSISPQISVDHWINLYEEIFAKGAELQGSRKLGDLMLGRKKKEHPIIYSSEEKKEALDLYNNQHWTQKQIADYFGCHFNTVGSWFSKSRQTATLAVSGFATA